MKKRLRKKLRRGEFKTFCFLCEGKVSSYESRKFLHDRFLSFTEENGLHVIARWGRTDFEIVVKGSFEYDDSRKRGRRWTYQPTTEDHRRLLTDWLRDQPEVASHRTSRFYNSSLGFALRKKRAIFEETTTGE